MDPEKILEYFIRFESIPLSRKGMRASGRHNSWVSFFFAPTSRSLIQDISPPRSVVQVVCKFRGKTWRAPREKYLLSAVCVFDLALFTVSYPFFPFFFFIVYPTFSRSITLRYYTTVAITPPCYYDLLRFTVTG